MLPLVPVACFVEHGLTLLSLGVCCVVIAGVFQPAQVVCHYGGLAGWGP
jgi:hypothetical protein